MFGQIFNRFWLNVMFLRIFRQANAQSKMLLKHITKHSSEQHGKLSTNSSCTVSRNSISQYFQSIIGKQNRSVRVHSFLNTICASMWYLLDINWIRLNFRKKLIQCYLLPLDVSRGDRKRQQKHCKFNNRIRNRNRIRTWHND